MYSDGETYEGQWVNNVKEGFGKYTYANGDVYEGEYVNGEKQGQGRCPNVRLAKRGSILWIPRSISTVLFSI